MQATIAMLNSWSADFLIAAQQVDDDANDVWSGWGSVILVLSIVGIAALVALVLIWQIFKTAQARNAAAITVAEQDAYRKLAEQSTAAQEALATDLATLNTSITDLRERVASIEKMMREVE